MYSTVAVDDTSKTGRRPASYITPGLFCEAQQTHRMLYHRHTSASHPSEQCVTGQVNADSPRVCRVPKIHVENFCREITNPEGPKSQLHKQAAVVRLAKDDGVHWQYGGAMPLSSRVSKDCSKEAVSAPLSPLKLVLGQMDRQLRCLRGQTTRPRYLLSTCIVASMPTCLPPASAFGEIWHRATVALSWRRA